MNKKSSLFCGIMSRNACRKGTHGCLFFSVSKLVSKGFYDERRVSSTTGQVQRMLLRATHWIDSARTFWRLVDLDLDCSLERHGTRALQLVTVGRGHVTRGTQTIAQLVMSL